jgi:hypothetical protein
VVGGASSVLGERRVAALAALAAVLAAYFAAHEHLPKLSTWWDVAVIALLLIPAVFATVWLVLPLWSERWTWIAGLVCVVLAIVFGVLGWEGAASFSKLGAATFFAWAFLELFEDVSWIVLVACIIPWVDAYSVWRGPTNAIVHHHRGVFSNLSFAYPVPGERGTANLGIPDMVFFALFLAASARFRLRPWLTWLLQTASFGATIAIAVAWHRDGLPALPLLSVAFLLANGDLLWRELRARRRASRVPADDELPLDPG